MKHTLITLLLLLTASLSLFAQSEQLGGTAIDRVNNKSLQGANVQVSNNIDRFSTTTNEFGQFSFSNLYAGVWQLVIFADGFGNYETPITVQSGSTLNLGTIFMYPAMVSNIQALSDMSSLESETSDYVQSGPALLSASQDVFTNLANFKFSEMRFKARGYDWNLGKTYLNGLLMNDVNTGNSPFSLWGGLNDAMRNQESTSGMEPTTFAVGNISGMTNVITRASQIRKGYSINYASSGSTYAHRLGVTWSNEIANDWFLAYAVSFRYSNPDNPLNWTTGTFYQGVSYFLGVEKKFDLRQSLALTVLGAPIKRGVSAASTQEVYDMLEDPYYNPNWGYQNGKIRNARMRNSHEPVVMLDYSNRINNRFKLSAAASYRFGNNGYTALDWYDAPDPRPDYYRYLPSYFTANDGKREEILRGWMTNENIRHINWDELYNVNYNNDVELNGVTINGNKGQSIPGLRSKYVIENRRADQHDINTGITVNVLVNDFLKVNGGLAYRWNRTEYFKEMYDLMGGDFWLDVDQFAERDFPNSEAIQNDMNNPNRIIKEGDKYGYNYYAFTQTEKVWAVAHFNIGKLDAYAGGDIGFTSFYRDGLYQKGLFPDNSYGKSETLSFLSYSGQLGGNYQITGNHILSANMNYVQRAPYFQDAFISPRTRNSTVENLEPEKIFAADLSYSLRMSSMKFRLSGFFTQIMDRSRVMMFYDDFYRAMSNFAMSGIDQRHLGVEFGADVYVWNGFSVKGAVAYGDYIYTSNPLLTQTVDNSNDVLSNQLVRWDGSYVSGTPQLATNLGIEYRAPSSWWAGVDLNYYNYTYIDMNPLRRTTEVRNAALDPEQMMHQEMFSPGFVLNANIGQWRTINRKYNVGIMLTINNILNNQKLQSGGYEQSRLSREIDDDGRRVDQYTPFPSKYFYMNGTSYFLNVFLRF
ncbi:MAG: carboxypeptidase regulatory-like domain-containing protein [Bacteroidales bacterium]|nr:carboxypeptidase regulatory-like domain-containing protein [Bacteroidales bacterium]